MLPPRNEKSITESATGVSPIAHDADERRVAQPGGPLGRREPLRVGLRVDELERVGRLEAAAISVNVPSSASCTIRSRDVTGKW